MAEIIITADLHIHSHRGESRRIDDGIKCLEWIYEVAYVENISTIIFAGDFLHHRFQLPTLALAKAFDVVKNATKKNIHSIFLLGNHDMIAEDNWSLHSLKGLFNCSLVTVIEQPTKLNIKGFDVDFLPYTPTPSKYLNAEPFINPANTLISHLAIANAVLNSRYNILSVEDDSKEKEHLDASKLDKWKKVWLGHYHYGHDVSKTVEYIGSPMQLTFGEANQVKHIAIYNVQNGSTRYINNLVSPPFYIIDNIKHLDQLSVKDAYIQITDDGSLHDKFELRKKLSGLGARQIEFIPIEQDVAGQTTKALDNISKLFNDKDKLIDGYVDGVKLPTGLDKAILKSIGKEIIHVN